METVIPPDKISGHVIQKYQFKVLMPDGSLQENGVDAQKSGEIQRYIFNELKRPEEETTQEEPDTTLSEMPSEPAEEEAPQTSVEELLKRVDELSGELVKAQMALEKEEQACLQKEEAARKEGYEEGVEAGKRACREEMAEEEAKLKERIAASVSALEESRKRFLQKVDTIEEELIETALDLAKQVIVKEVSQESEKIALKLARLLLDEVKEAAKVTLKVNPADLEYLQEHLPQGDGEGVELVGDPAVAPGGVVVLSDIGTIDGQIMQRFDRIKEAVFSTVRH